MKGSYIPGFTARSAGASLMAMVFCAIVVQLAGATDAWSRLLGTEVLPVPAMMIFLVLVLVSGTVYAIGRVRLLTREELLCVLFAVMLATPLMPHGFWRLFLGVSGSIVRNSDFEKFDALRDKLWPHGPNLLAEAFEGANRKNVTAFGQVKWENVEYNAGKTGAAVTLRNTGERAVSSVRIRLPLREGSRAPLRLQEAHLLAVLARARDMGAESRYFCRFYYDEREEFSQEAFTSTKETERDRLHRHGFLRLGNYGLTLPPDIKNHVYVEFGLEGDGTVTFCDPWLADVRALEGASNGRRLIAASAYEKLPPEARAGLIVKPDNMWSLAGLKFLLAGYYPWRDWLTPAAGWSSFVMLLLTAAFALGVIMRRQWLQNERYPMPLAQAPLALLGEENGASRALASIWRNRLMWTGFGITFFWCLMRGWRSFNPAVPDMSVNVNLKSYLADPGWGDTWNGVTFSISALYLGIGLFMELNVLISLVLGFFLFRMQHWFGEGYGLSADNNFPYKAHQFAGAYAAYAFMIVFFARKYLWRVFKMALKGIQPAGGEAVSYRAAFLLLMASAAGAYLWSRWADLPAGGVMVFFLFLVSAGFVAAKMRTECGTPHAGFAPGSACIIIPLIGGMSLFGPEGIIFAGLAAALFCQECFFVLPGIQLELLEIGRRFRVRPGHLAATAVWGVLGGLLIGGWVYLSTANSIGAENYPITGEFMPQNTGFKEYNKQLTRETKVMLAEETGQPPPAHKTDPGIYACLYAAGGTVIVTVLRQVFAGFWFHPMGFVVGPSPMMQSVWGSLLLAWFIRFMVLKLGGAATVRKKLWPAATGIIVAVVAAYLVFFIINEYVFFFHPGATRFSGAF